MAEEQKPQKWWQTVPGVLTATAATITAVTGLIVALHQAGFFSAIARHIPQAQSNAATSQDSQLTAIQGTGQKFNSTQNARALPAGAEVRLGTAAYKILAARLERYNTENLTLRLTVRMTSTRAYDDNFLDSSFSLLVDGTPRAPVGGLNRLVRAHSAEEGEVVFVVPVRTQSAVLQIRHDKESTEIPLDLSTRPT